MLWEKLWHIFLAMARVGTLGFGGGQATIPLMEIEAVQNTGWLSAQEFGEAYALGNSLPGPITTKMAAFIGYKQAGLPGAVTGVLGMILPSVVAMLLLTVFFLRFKDLPQVKGLLKGLRPVIVVLLILVTVKIGRGAIQIGPISYAIAAIAMVAIGYFKVHPVIVIVASMIFGVLFLA